MWLINRVQPLRIVPRLRVRDIEESDYSPAISTDVLVGFPLVFVLIIVVTLALVMWLVVSILVERVLDAFVEDFFGVVRAVRPFRPRNGVRETEVVEERWEVVRVVFDVKFLCEKVLNLLLLPGLSLTETFDEFLLLGVVELRGPAAPEVRRQFAKSAFVPPANPVTGCSFRNADVVGCLSKRCTTVQTLEKDESFVLLDVVSLSQ